MLRKPRTLLATALLVLLAATGASAMVYEITVIDEIPGGMATGQPFSPPVCVVHGPGYSQWAPGEYASPGLIIVAEEGTPTTLAQEAMDSADVSAVVVGDGPFFDQVTIMIEGEPGQLFSVAWMLGRTNDLFSGLYDVVLPEMGTTLELDTDAWDAGSEVNTGLIAHLGFYGNPMVGPDEDNPIMSVDHYTIYDDPDHGQLDWEFPPCGHVTIVPMGEVAVDEATWSGVKSLFE